MNLCKTTLFEMSVAEISTAFPFVPAFKQAAIFVANVPPLIAVFKPLFQLSMTSETKSTAILSCETRATMIGSSKTVKTLMPTVSVCGL